MRFVHQTLHVRTFEITLLFSGGGTRTAFEAKLGEFGVDPSAIRNGKRGGRRGLGKFRGRKGGFRGPAPTEDAPASDDGN